METTNKQQGSSKGWQVRRVGSVTLEISKPKRNRRKLRQSRLKNKRRAR
ncbi:MAG: hypothetical protein ACRD2B_01955 [Terriglobia bacterium]